LFNVFPQVTSYNFNVEYAPSLSCVNHVVIVCYVLYNGDYTAVFDAKSICVMNLIEDHLQIFVFSVK